jgi:RNA polymerase sigma-70 factor (ECF subfamily)
MPAIQAGALRAAFGCGLRPSWPPARCLAASRSLVIFALLMQSSGIKDCLFSQGLLLEFDDNEIIRRIKLGEADAYEELVRKYHRHLLNFIFRILRDEYGVEDIGQEVFISVYRSLSGFDERCGVPFSAWLFIVARNKCISELRKRKTAKFIPIYKELPAPDGSSPDEIFIQKEQKAALEQALERIEEPFKEALLKSLKGSSIDEIARSFNVPVNTVKTRLFRAREKLRTLLKRFS